MQLECVLLNGLQTVGLLTLVFCPSYMGTPAGFSVEFCGSAGVACNSALSAACGSGTSKLYLQTGPVAGCRAAWVGCKRYYHTPHFLSHYASRKHERS
jgi:hypothetical protein